MKKSTAFSVMVFLTALIAVPVLTAYAWWGSTRNLSPTWHKGPDFCRPYLGKYGALSQEQRDKLDKLDKRFIEETEALRKDLWTRQSELDLLKIRQPPEPEKFTAVQKTVLELDAKLDKKEQQHRIEAAEIAPGVALPAPDREAERYAWNMKGDSQGPCRE